MRKGRQRYKQKMGERKEERLIGIWNESETENAEREKKRRRMKGRREGRRKRRSKRGDGTKKGDRSREEGEEHTTS